LGGANGTPGRKWRLLVSTARLRDDGSREGGSRAHVVRPRDRSRRDWPGRLVHVSYTSSLRDPSWCTDSAQPSRFQVGRAGIEPATLGLKVSRSAVVPLAEP